MSEVCERCGRAYRGSEDYDAHACITETDIDKWMSCYEEVDRRGELQPCGLPAVAARIDPEWNSPYPVCKRHTRGPMVPFSTVFEAGRLAGFYEGRRNALGGRPTIGSGTYTVPPGQRYELYNRAENNR